MINRSFNKLFNYLKLYKLDFIVIILVNILNTIFLTIQPSIFGNIIDSISNLNIGSLKLNILFIIVCFFVSSLFSIIRSYISAKLACKMELDLKNKIFTNMLDLNLLEFESIENGQFINKLENDVKSFSSLFTNNISIITDILTVILIGLILIKLNIVLAIITFCTFPISFFIFKYSGKLIKMKEIEFKKTNDNYFSFIQEILNSFKLIKILNSQDFFINRFNCVQSNLYKLILCKVKLNIKGNNITQLVNFISYILMIVIAVYQIFNGKLTLGGLVAFNTYSNMFMSSLFSLCKLNTVIQEANISIKRIFTALDNRTTINKNINNKIYYKNNTICLNNISFQYPNGLNKLFSNFNLSINQNSLTIIKGSSGLGKTTLFNIISGLYDNYSGKIYIGNVNIKDIPKDELRRKIFLMQQEPFLFSSTIRENFLLGKSNATDEEISSICKKVNIDNYICSLPDKYNTKIGCDGVNLSIGQKQRIALAIALIADSDIYLLDEITSALDLKNEEIIMNVLKEISINKTILLISHRNTTFKYADKIIDLENIDKEVMLKLGGF